MTLQDAAVAPAGAPGMGDNIPPTRLDAFKELLVEKTAALKSRILELQVGLARVPETIDETNESVATDFIAQVKDVIADAETLRRELKGPIDAEGKAIQEHFRALVDHANASLALVQERHDAWHDEKERLIQEAAEAERIAAEAESKRQADEAARLKAEADEKAKAATTARDRTEAAQTFERAQAAEGAAAAAGATAEQAVKTAAAPVHIKGDYGSTAHRTTRTVFEIEDEADIPPAALWPFIDTAAKEKAIRAAIAKGVRAIPGVRIFEKRQTIVRR